jgi:hypothetical protein
VGGICGTHGRGEESVEGFGVKARRKETTRKTGLDGRMGSECNLRRLVRGLLNGFNWLRIGTGGGIV